MPSAPIVADWIVDATFRAMVGLEHAQYWILDTSAGVIWVADPPTSLSDVAIGPFTVVAATPTQ